MNEVSLDLRIPSVLRCQLSGVYYRLVKCSHDAVWATSVALYFSQNLELLVVTDGDEKTRMIFCFHEEVFFKLI